MIFAEFIAPYTPSTNFSEHSHHRPSIVFYSKVNGIGPQVQKKVLLNEITKEYARVRNEYYKIEYGEKPSMSFMTKNAGFLTKNIPFASKKAEGYFNNAIESAKRSGAKGLQGMAYLGLGLLYKAKKRNVKAKKCISDAIKIFEECDAHVYLEQAKEALTSLE